MSKKSWTKEADKLLQQEVERIIKLNGDALAMTPDGFTLRAVLWKKLKVPGRTPGALQGRWVTHLSPNTVRDDWTDVEDKYLMESVKSFPLKSMGWSKRATWLAEKMGIDPPRRRGGGDVNDRYFKLQKKAKISSSKIDEDQSLKSEEEEMPDKGKRARTSSTTKSAKKTKKK